MAVYKYGQTIFRRATASHFRGHNKSNFMENSKKKILFPNPELNRYPGASKAYTLPLSHPGWRETKAYLLDGQQCLLCWIRSVIVGWDVWITLRKNEWKSFELQCGDCFELIVFSIYPSRSSGKILRLFVKFKFRKWHFRIIRRKVNKIERTSSLIVEETVWSWS